MKIIKKEEINKIKVIYNKKLFWTILILIGLLIFLMYFIIQNKEDNNQNINEKICVPASCCHPTECILTEKKLDCSGNICSSVCSGPLDCGMGHCELINNNCEVVSNAQK